MEKIQRITLNKEEQQVLKDYYKIIEEFSDFTNLDMGDSADWLSELVLDYGSLTYMPLRRYAGVEVIFQNEND